MAKSGPASSAARLVVGGDSERLPITRPALGDAELEAVQRPVEDGWIVQGPEVAEFERRFVQFTGARHAVATTSCTTALHLAVAALGLEAGDEVIVPAFTWVSTANVVEYMGAKPVFCDVRLDTYNIDESLIEPLIGEKTVGLIPVHLFGLSAAMGPIRELAERHGLWIVEDAACGFGAWQGQEHAGTMSDAGCFSFHPRKTITTGEGGMLVTDNDRLAEIARARRDHGASRSDLDRHSAKHSFLLADFKELGFNYRMTDIQGALGCAQMDRGSDLLAERTRLAKRYGELLAPLDWLITPVVPPQDVHGWQAYVCLFRPEEPTLENAERLFEQRIRLMEALEAAGIATRPGTHAAAATDYYADKYGFEPARLPNAYLAERLTLTLPLFPGMDDSDQERVVTELQRAIEAI